MVAGVEYDDNVLRVPNGGLGHDRCSDRIGLKADKRYGLQRFRADIEASTTNTTMLSRPRLPHDQLRPRLGLVNYAAGPRRGQRGPQGVPRDLPGHRRTGVNRTGLRTERVELAEGIYELGAAWRLLAGISHTRSDSSQPGSWDGSP